MTSRDNVVGTALQGLGGVIIAAFTLRALMVIGEFGGGVAFEVFLQGVIYGLLLIGFGEVIKLMQGLFNQREPDRPVKEAEVDGKVPLRNSSENKVFLEDRNRIMDFYTKRKIIVDDIEPTPYDGYAIIHHDGKKDIVDLNNFEIEILTEAQLGKNPELRSLLD